MWGSFGLLITVFTFLPPEVAGRALQLSPITDPSDFTDHTIKRNTPDGLMLLPISDPGVLTHGRPMKREAPGNECFEPSSQHSFFWGSYSGDNLFIANFTLSNPGDEEFILPVEDFAKRLKSIHCGSQTSPYMKLQFNDQESFQYARSAWEWVNAQDINHFTLVTEPDQCYTGDNRSPYLVKDIKFETSTLTAVLHAEEKEWAEMAHTFKLHLGHEYIDPSKVDLTHPHLVRRDDSVLDLAHDWNLRLFEYSADSGETAGLKVTADAQISTGGQIISDFDIETKWFIPRDVKLSIRPQGLHALFQLKLAAEGRLGKPLDYALQPEIEIPVLALNIKGILEVGPYVTMGVHLGSTALEGTASVTTGAKASIEDSARVNLKLREPEDNSISGWTPQFEKLDTEITASIHGSVKAWAELGITIKAEVLGRWGYQAGLDAQLPYFEASLDAMYNENGVCGTQKTAGVELDASVGININLNAGEVDEAPKFKKDLFETSWPLFSTCVGFGGDVFNPTQAPVATSVPASESAMAPVATSSGAEIEPPQVPSQPMPTQMPAPTDAGSATGSSRVPEQTSPQEPSVTSTQVTAGESTAPAGGEPVVTIDDGSGPQPPKPVSTSDFTTTTARVSLSETRKTNFMPNTTVEVTTRPSTWSVHPTSTIERTHPTLTSQIPSSRLVPHYSVSSSQSPAYQISSRPSGYGIHSPSVVSQSAVPSVVSQDPTSRASAVLITESPTTTPCKSTNFTTFTKRPTDVYV